MVKIERDGTMCMRCGRKFEIGETITDIEMKQIRFINDNAIEVIEPVDTFIDICEKCNEEIADELYPKWNELEDIVNKDLAEA